MLKQLRDNITREEIENFAQECVSRYEKKIEKGFLRWIGADQAGMWDERKLRFLDDWIADENPDLKYMGRNWEKKQERIINQYIRWCYENGIIDDYFDLIYDNFVDNIETNYNDSTGKIKDWIGFYSGWSPTSTDYGYRLNDFLYEYN